MKKLILAFGLMFAVGLAQAADDTAAALTASLLANPGLLASLIATSAAAAPKFPMWFQPNPGIGQILVNNQAELDEYKARDWSPKPLPGSHEGPPAGPDLDVMAKKLAAERAAFEAEREAWMLSQSSQAPSAPSTPGAAPSTHSTQPQAVQTPAPGTASPKPAPKV